MRSCVLLAAFAWCSCGPVAVASPLLMEFAFNDTGTQTVSSGDTKVELEFLNQERNPDDLHSAIGQGVAGDLQGHKLFGADRSFDNSASASMQGSGGIALNADQELIPSLMSWTVSGWYKTAEDVPLQGGGTVLFMSPPVFTGDPGLANSGFAVRAENPNGIRVSVNGKNTTAGASGVDTWLDTQTWVFFAVTYDGDLDADNLSFYRGYRNALEGRDAPQVSLIATASFPVGATIPAPGLSIGNRTDDFGRAFDGFLDNIRLFGSPSDQSGALSLAELGQLRASDLALLGDFDTNLQFNAADIDRLSQAIRESSTDVASFDLNADGLLNDTDRQQWVHAIARTYFGDANLDRTFDSADLITVFAAGKYEDQLAGNASWADGDWDGDGDFTSTDLVAAFSDGGYDAGPRAATPAVPEPDLSVWMILLIASSSVSRRR